MNQYPQTTDKYPSNMQASNKNGLGLLHDKINTALVMAQNTHSTLNTIAQDLYDPRPTKTADLPSTGPGDSVENLLNVLLNQLRDLDRLASRILSGDV